MSIYYVIIRICENWRAITRVHVHVPVPRHDHDDTLISYQAEVPFLKMINKLIFSKGKLGERTSTITITITITIMICCGMEWNGMCCDDYDDMLRVACVG